MLSLKSFKSKNKNNNFIYNFKNTYGIGSQRLRNILLNSGINTYLYNVKAKKVISKKIEIFFKNTLFSTTLRSNKKKNLNFFWNIRLYRGYRYRFKLPARGQRTKTNARTKKTIKYL